MINNLFGFKTYLHILQLEGYSVSRFIAWLLKHQRSEQVGDKKPLIMTYKIRLIFILSLLYFVLFAVALFLGLKLIGIVIGFLFIAQPYLLIIIATLTLKPIEEVLRYKIKITTRNKIKKLKNKGLIIIGVTGSYGKTTTKDYLYSLLKTKYKVLKTPESYNTLLGIAKVVDLELSFDYEIFICEMGAFKKGEILELCKVILPDHGILIGINEQHLERFKSIENTIKAKFELMKYLPQKAFHILNADDPIILENYKNYPNDYILYGNSTDIFSYKDFIYEQGNSSCTFIFDSKEYKLENLNVVSVGNISNVLGAATLAFKLGVQADTLIQTVCKLTPLTHRLNIYDRPDGVTIIDDSYSSNKAGFIDALLHLSSYLDRPKVVITPGIVELGKSSVVIHEELGRKLDQVCDYVLLVGDNERTKALAKYIDKSKIVVIEDFRFYEKSLDELRLDRPVILIENDLPDNY